MSVFLKNYFILILCIGAFSSINAQKEDVQDSLNRKFTNVNVNGYARFYSVYRRLYSIYDADVLQPKSFIVNGVFPDSPLENGLPSGYREPLLMLELSGKPSPATEFRVDFLLDNQLTGNLADTSRRIQIYRFLNLGGTVDAQWSEIDIKMGGIYFLTMSPLTMWRYTIRDDMFERYPWEWSHRSFERYENFYEGNSISMDQRLSDVSFQGVSTHFRALPGRTGLMFAYGKTDVSNNGFQSFLNNNYKFITAARFYKYLQRHTLAGNFYRQKGFISNSAPSDEPSNEEEEIVATVQSNIYLGENSSLDIEAGVATFTNPAVTENNYDPVINLNYRNEGIGKTGIACKFHAFYVGENYLNLNGEPLNTSPYGGQFGLEPSFNANSFSGAITEIGQMANNRTGASFTIEKRFSNLKVSLGLQNETNIENTNNFITYQHYAGGFNRSRFVFYRAQLGPYQRVINAWRRSFEQVRITDPEFSGDKFFSTLDISLAYNSELFGLPVILSSYTNINSVNDSYSLIPESAPDAFINTLYEELLGFVQIKKGITILGLWSIQSNQGNNRINTARENGEQFENNVPDTETGTIVSVPTYNPEGNTLDQTSFSYGVGLDLDISENSGLYLRQRWYSHQDDNFTRDRFRGWEFSTELKIRF